MSEDKKLVAMDSDDEELDINQLEGMSGGAYIDIQPEKRINNARFRDSDLKVAITKDDIYGENEGKDILVGRFK